MAHRLVRGVPPSIDLEAERALQSLLVALADQRLVRSAHDCSDGGLAVTLAECCFDTGGIGAEVADRRHRRVGSSRPSIAPRRSSASPRRGSSSPRRRTMCRHVLERAAAAGVPARLIGRTGGSVCGSRWRSIGDRSGVGRSRARLVVAPSGGTSRNGVA